MPRMRRGNPEGRPRMKRLRVILLFLLLGAIVNVAVAWGYTYSWTTSEADAGEDVSRGRGEFSDTGEYWALTKYENSGFTMLFGHAILEADPRRARFLEKHKESIQSMVPSWSQLAIPPTMDVSIWDYSAGWPCRSLYYYWDSDTSSHSHAWQIRESPNERYLPLAPIWPGIVINTLFYAVFMWLLLTGPLVLRRTIRHKRGLCVKCAYDLRGADHLQCPECGWR